jgi:hypothetical protein
VRTSLPSFSLRTHGSRPWTLLAAAVAVLAMSGASWATSCSGTISLTNANPQILCVMPEASPVLPMTVDFKYMEFSSTAVGSVVLYTNSLDTTIADVVTFSNVNGMATISFTPNTNGSMTMPSGLILGKYTAGGYEFISLSMTNGKTMHVGICSSTAAGCNSGADSLRVSVGAPEPGSFFLMGTGLLGPGLWGLATGRLRRWKELIKS